MINFIKKSLSIVMALTLVLGVFAINASATTVSSDYDTDFAAIMADDYYSTLMLNDDDNGGLDNYNIVSIRSGWSSMGWTGFNGRYNYIKYGSGSEVEIVSKQGYVIPYGFTVGWEVFTHAAETGTTEVSVDSKV